MVSDARCAHHPGVWQGRKTVPHIGLLLAALLRDGQDVGPIMDTSVQSRPAHILGIPDLDTLAEQARLNTRTVRA